MSGKSCCTPERDAPAAPPALAPGHAAAGEADQEFIELAGGAFVMGTDSHEGFPSDGEGPPRDVWLSPFAIAPTTVTNAQFSAFVRAKGYITQAEQAGSSFVFYLQVPADLRAKVRQFPQGLPWWLDIADASWQRPEGPGSHIRERMEHPVVHVSWNDAQAYCSWASVKLPTEAQWEFAARGGLDRKLYAWGNEMPANPPCNIWQGDFPYAPAPGWQPAPVSVRSLEPNGYGLYNMAGNVWEWCDDWFHPEYHSMTARMDPSQSAPTGRKSTRGGSFLCHDSYCNRYRVAARGSNTPESSASNIGFRVTASSLRT
jgi:formylglycine-generating enzyme